MRSEMDSFGILGVGAFVPRLRIDRSLIADAHRWMAPGLKSLGKGERAFCSWDEDAVTMAVEAARDCPTRKSDGDVAVLTLASTTFPYADLQHASLVAAALGMAKTISTSDMGFSQRAGTSGLLQALKSGEETLFVASDRPNAKPASTQELQYGAGAAAFRIGSGDPIAKLLGHASVTEPFVDHFRAAGARFDYYWEERWVRDEGYLKLAPSAVKAALDRADLAIDDIAHFVMALPMRGAAEAVAKKLGYAGMIADNYDQRCGYAGAAHALLMLVGALERAKPGERILLIGFGQGVDALVFETTEALAKGMDCRGMSGALADGVKTDSYERMISYYDNIDLEWGMRAEKSNKTILTEQHRAADQIMPFVAGKCRSCGTVQFPQLTYCVSPGCQAPAARFEQMSLADAPCRVMTVTADWLSYHPAPPLYVGFVQFDNGARLLMETVDVGPEGVDIGTPLKAVFRIQARDRERGYNRYFWKATPIAATVSQGDA